MFQFFSSLRLRLDDEQKNLVVQYAPKTDKPIFDICDTEGTILKSGKITDRNLKVKVADLINSAYILLILDGDQIRSKRFEIHR